MELRKSVIIGVMGGADVHPDSLDTAFQLGQLIAENGWILLNGGRNTGVMLASSRGAKSNNGITIGILPGHDKSGISPFIDIPIVTGLGDARNYINVLSSDVVVICPGSAGTISEAALALKNNKPVILLNFDIRSVFAEYVGKGLYFVKTPEECITLIKSILT